MPTIWGQSQIILGHFLYVLEKNMQIINKLAKTKQSKGSEIAVVTENMFLQFGHHKFSIYVHGIVPSIGAMYCSDRSIHFFPMMNRGILCKLTSKAQAAASINQTTSAGGEPASTEQLPPASSTAPPASSTAMWPARAANCLLTNTAIATSFFNDESWDFM